MSRSSLQLDEKKPLPVPSSAPSKFQALCSSLKCLGSCSLFPRPKEQELYTSLPHRDSIRLVRIHPGQAGQQMKCTLQLARSGHSCPAYEALSYVWHYRPGMQEMVCNGVPHAVHTNLFDALERLRHPTKSRLIWVDALSINQGDSKEVSHQVRRMNQIYHQARRVIVWLGTDENNDAPLAFSVLCVSVNATSARAKPVTYTTTSLKKQSYCVQCTHPPPPLKSEEWKSVTRLFGNDWWSRIWVLQEIVLARSATFIWGASELAWNIIGEAINVIISQSDLHGDLGGQNLDNANIMYQLGKIRFSKLRNTHPFLHFLDISRSFKCTEAKDKVFSLLGFPNAHDPSKDSVYNTYAPEDYNVSATYTYKYVAKRCIETDQNLDILSYAFHTGPTKPNKKSMELPSWVPDWNTKKVIHPFTAFEVTGNYHRAGMAKNMEASFQGDMLLVKGVVVDTVTDAHVPTPHTHIEQSEPHLKGLLEWCMARTTASPYLLASTLSGGREASGALITDTDRHLADFASFVALVSPNAMKTIWADDAEVLSELAVKGDRRNGRGTMWSFACHRSPFITTSGKLGLGSGAVIKGDIVVVLWGGQVPYVLREDLERGGYTHIGECYIDGLMKGEVGERVGSDAGKGYTEQVFELR